MRPGKGPPAEILCALFYPRIWFGFGVGWKIEFCGLKLKDCFPICPFYSFCVLPDLQRRPCLGWMAPTDHSHWRLSGFGPACKGLHQLCQEVFGCGRGAALAGAAASSQCPSISAAALGREDRFKGAINYIIIYGGWPFQIQTLQEQAPSPELLFLRALC
jgi:hypothetical protein